MRAEPEGLATLAGLTLGLFGVALFAIAVAPWVGLSIAFTAAAGVAGAGFSSYYLPLVTAVRTAAAAFAGVRVGGPVVRRRSDRAGRRGREHRRGAGLPDRDRAPRGDRGGVGCDRRVRPSVRAGRRRAGVRDVAGRSATSRGVGRRRAVRGDDAPVVQRRRRRLRLGAGAVRCRLLRAGRRDRRPARHERRRQVDAPQGDQRARRCPCGARFSSTGTTSPGSTPGGRPSAGSCRCPGAAASSRHSRWTRASGWRPGCTGAPIPITSRPPPRRCGSTSRSSSTAPTRPRVTCRAASSRCSGWRWRSSPSRGC